MTVYLNAYGDVRVSDTPEPDEKPLPDKIGVFFHPYSRSEITLDPAQIEDGVDFVFNPVERLDAVHYYAEELTWWLFGGSVGQQVAVSK